MNQVSSSESGVRGDPRAFLESKELGGGRKSHIDSSTWRTDDGIVYNVSPSITVLANGRSPPVPLPSGHYYSKQPLPCAIDIPAAVDLDSEHRNTATGVAVGGAAAANVLAGAVCAGLAGVAVAGAICLLVLAGMRARDRRERDRLDLHNENQRNAPREERRTPSRPHTRNRVQCRRRGRRCILSDDSRSSTLTSASDSVVSGVVVDVHPNRIHVRSDGRCRALGKR